MNLKKDWNGHIQIVQTRISLLALLSENGNTSKREQHLYKDVNIFQFEWSKTDLYNVVLFKFLCR